MQVILCNLNVVKGKQRTYKGSLKGSANTKELNEKENLHIKTL